VGNKTKDDSYVNFQTANGTCNEAYSPASYMMMIMMTIMMIYNIYIALKTTVITFSIFPSRKHKNVL